MSKTLSKTELIKILVDADRKGMWSDRQIRVLIESLWRDPVPPIPEPDGLRSGGIVTWIELLEFNVSAAYYYLGGRAKRSPDVTVTLDAADATYPRIDVFAVDINETVVIIKGTPAENPLAPSVDPATQIYLTQVLIPAGATEPETPGGDPIENIVVYDENEAGEWTPAVVGTTASFVCETTPYKGTYCAEISNIDRNDYITFTAAAPLNFTAVESLNFHIRLKNYMRFTQSVFAQLFLNGTSVTNAIRLNILRTGLIHWYSVSAAVSEFTKTGKQFDQLRFIWKQSSGNNNHLGFFLDDVYFQKGIEQPEVVADTYVTGLEFDELTRMLTLTQNEKDDIEVEIPETGEANVQSDWNQATNTEPDFIKNKPTIPTVNADYLKDWIEFEFRDIEAGTAADYVLDLKALVGYTIDSAVLQVDAGTLTVAVKIGTTAVTSISAVAVDTDIVQTTATGANTVAAGNKVILAVSTTYTGAPTLIRGKLNLTRT